MTEYLIAAHEEWVPDYSEDQMQEMSQAVKALRAEMKAAGVYVFLGGLDNSAPVFSVDATSGSPVFTDGPYIETKEHLGGFTIIDVPDEDAARMWAAEVAAACLGPTRCAAFKSHGSPPKARVCSHRPFVQQTPPSPEGVGGQTVGRGWKSVISP